MVVLKEVKNMFWGVTLDGGKHYTQTVERSFHISMAALEPLTNPASAAATKMPVSVMIQHDKAEFMLCSLEYGRMYQQPLDLNFTEGEEVTFFLNGSGIVHLTGYLVDDSQMSDLEDLEDPDYSLQEMSESGASDSESDTVPTLVTADGTVPDEDTLIVSRKRKSKTADRPGKKVKILEYMQGNEEDDSDDDEYDPGYEFVDDEESDEIDSDEEIEDDDDDDEEFEDSQEPLLKKGKKETQEATPKSEKKKSLQETPKQTPKQQQAQQNGEDVNKKKKKKKKKKKTDSSETPSSAGDGHKQSKQIKESTPHMKKVLAGGTVAEELKIGHGPEAKSGKMVHVYYSGKLQKSGKQFDSCTGGKPFKFRLGKREVISGWDNGLLGMKVGGKRRLTVPPQQGYGNQKQGPIPGNSTLIFDVELKAVS